MLRRLLSCSVGEGRLRLLVFAFCAALVALLWMGLFAQLTRERNLLIEAREAESDNLARLFEEHVLRTLAAAGVTLKQLEIEYKRQGRRLDLGKYLRDRQPELEPYGLLSVADEKGNLVLNSVPFTAPQNIAGLENYQFHLHNPTRDVFISKPRVGVITGKATIYLTRRMNKADGSFGGNTTVGMDPQYFSRFYEQIDLGKDSIISLIGRDGVVRARQSNQDPRVGQDFSRNPDFLTHMLQQDHGRFINESQLDHIVRLISFRTVRGYPLFVLVGTSKAVLLDTFDRRRQAYLWSAAFISALILAFGAVVVIQMSRQAKTTADLRAQTERLQLGQSAAGMIVMDWEIEGDLLTLGGPPEWLRGPLPATGKYPLFKDQVHPEDREQFLAMRATMVETLEPQSMEFRVVRTDGEVRWVDSRHIVIANAGGKAVRILLALHDITDRKRVEEELTRLAQFDAITGLPNRLLFRDRLAQVLLQAQRNEWPAGVLFIDLDRFKLVNDTLGHSFGDRLLAQVAARLARSVREGDTVGRLGGDEFAVALASLAHASDAGLVAQKVIDSLAEPFELDGHKTYVTASVGIASYPADGAQCDTLLKNADIAMYRVKSRGRNGYQFYMPEMNQRAAERLQLETELHGALERGEFVLHYQPKVHLGTRRIEGFEALLRWNHPGRGMISPAEFIPLLEDTSLIVPVGEWVLREVCRQIRAWRDGGFLVRPVAVNISARQFRRKDLDGIVSSALSDAELDALLLHLEITESLLMDDTQATARTLHALKLVGVGISVDDFGAGYSSLGYLQRFPLDTLKIDRSFIDGIGTSQDAAAITLAIINLAHNLKLGVIAEGVETQGQADFLSKSGCDQAQGYFFSRPLGVRDCEHLMRSGAPGIAT